ncbi:PhnE/PtxC family ABC transporter permease [Mycoplasmopsis lipofaciens]|uniref:PhnE/PtxC family ABC transporter permease n=1 Tax=Mycoplasmopsis lipofaciens TaxID=114884 RepID=UPI00068E6C50|nr:ABC transporter permease subunit [Mycoplasmopsis lipofaciens]
MQINKINKKIIIIKKIFFYQVQSELKITQNKLKPIWKHILILLLFALIIFMFSKLDFSFTGSFGKSIFIKNFKELIKFSNTSTYPIKQNLFIFSIKQLYFTIKYAIVGTFIGFIAAVISSILTNKTYNNKYWSFISKTIILFFRAIPELVFINFFTLAFYPELALLMIFMWFSWLWLHKYYSEIIENTDTTPYYISISQGNGKFKAFTKEIFPRISNRIISLFLYSFEANMRWATILAALGAPGIGTLIKYGSENTYNFKELGIPLSVLMSFIIILEIINMLLNRYVFQIDSKKIKSKNYNELAKRINWRYYFKMFSLLIIFIFSLYTLITVNHNRTSLESVKNFFHAWINPNWNVFSLNVWDIDYNPILQILQSLMFAFLSLFVTAIVVLLALPLNSKKSNNTYVALFFRILNAFIRIMPSLVIIFIFNPLLNSRITLLIFVLGIHESSSMTKQLVEAMDNIDNIIINNLKIQGYSKTRIYFKYILPTIKLDIISWLIFYFEMSFRNAITYSIFTNGNLKLGSGINSYLNHLAYKPYEAMAYIWVITLTIMLINLISQYIINNYIRRNKISFLNQNLYRFKYQVKKYRISKIIKKQKLLF